MNLMEKFADPELIHSLTTGEKLIGSGITTLMGMGVTFVVLFFLWGCLALMARVLNRPAKEQPAAAAGPVAAAASAPGKQSQATQMVKPVMPEPVPAAQAIHPQHGVTSQVISAMTAAVSAYENSDAPLSISRIESIPANWTHAGRMDGRKGLQ